MDPLDELEAMSRREVLKAVGVVAIAGVVGLIAVLVWSTVR